MPNALSPRAPAVAPSPFRAEMVHAASLRDVLTGIFHHGRAIVLTIGTIMAAGLLATLLMRPSYRAQTRLLALDSAAYGAPLAAGEKFSLEQSMAPYRIADVEMQLLGSAEVTHDAAALNLPPGANADAVARRSPRAASTICSASARGWTSSGARWTPASSPMNPPTTSTMPRAPARGRLPPPPMSIWPAPKSPARSPATATR